MQARRRCTRIGCQIGRDDSCDLPEELKAKYRKEMAGDLPSQLAREPCGAGP